jgi:predicted nucleotidyltransferase
MQNSKLFSIKDIKIPGINLEDLIVIKCAAGRYQDIADIQALVRGSIPVNKDYIVKQLELLHISVPEAVTPFILQ